MTLFMLDKMEERANILREMKICRFCLDSEAPLSNIYKKDGKQSIPLPLQIMACVAIEVFENDGMPQLICNTCRSQTIQAYTFKTTCKKSDDALKIFLATGSMVKPIKPKNETQQELQVAIKPEQQISLKRSEPEITTSKGNDSKKIKSDSENVTLNYKIQKCANIKLVKNVDVEEHDNNVEQSFSIEQDMGQEELQEDKSDLEEEEEEEVEDEEEDEDGEAKINPVLKLPQVQTDIFPCSHCERSFPLKQLLDLHMKNHTRERTFECTCCGRKFFTKYDLAKHVQTHSDAKPFACVVCNKQFSRESLLHRHEKIHVDVPKYLCTTCDKTFLTKEDLDAHSEKHKKKRPFMCRICNKRFVFKQGLERHELTHADEKPHKCNYCEASFTSAIKLMRHITSHAGLRPYPCKLCGRTFLLSHHLTRHMRSHYAAKSPLAQPIGQHKCDVCSMSFRRKDSLINHSAIHSMVNLKCVICNTKFENAVQVKDHITIHLSGLPYPCDKCDYSFETQDQLEEHEVKHAQMEYEEQIEQEVVQEAAQAQQIAEDCEDYSGDEISEFTITCDSNESPEVVRRSKRESKIKNYAQFLNAELGSDIEDEIIEEQNDSIEEVVTIEKGANEEETIKPIVRTEGTKVYRRKNAPEKPKVLPEVNVQPATAPIDQITQPPIARLESLGLNKQLIHGLPNKQYVNVKVGDKMMRVQKFIVSKAEVEAMAREGKLELGADNILVKVNKGFPSPQQKQVTPSKNIIIDSIIDHNKPTSSPKMVVKKTYAKKSLSTKMESSGNEATQSAIVISEDGTNTIVESC